jgi:hypothetical protein
MNRYTILNTKHDPISDGFFPVILPFKNTKILVEPNTALYLDIRQRIPSAHFYYPENEVILFTPGEYLIHEVKEDFVNTYNLSIDKQAFTEITLSTKTGELEQASSTDTVLYLGSGSFAKELIKKCKHVQVVEPDVNKLNLFLSDLTQNAENCSFVNLEVVLKLEDDDKASRVEVLTCNNVDENLSLTKERSLYHTVRSAAVTIQSLMETLNPSLIVIDTERLINKDSLLEHLKLQSVPILDLS